MVVVMATAAALRVTLLMAAFQVKAVLSYTAKAPGVPPPKKMY